MGYICSVMRRSHSDEVLANFLTKPKGFLMFFWIYAILYGHMSYQRLQKRFARVHELSLERVESHRSSHAVVCVSGFLNSRADIFRPWEIGFQHPWTYGQIYCVRWETDVLLQLGKQFQAIYTKAAAQAAKSLQFAI